MQGNSGSWSVSIDETIAGPQQWFLQIEGPTIDLYCLFPSIALIDRLSNCLNGWIHRSETQPDSVELGTIDGVPFVLVRDNEYTDRVFIRTSGSSATGVRLTIAGSDARDLATAFSQAALELQE